MEFKGTKGRWKAVPDFENDGYSVVLIEEQSFGVTYIARDIRQGLDEGQADALLISKAPEMLEMLKYSVEAIKAINSMGATTAIINRIEKLIRESTELKD